MIRYDYSISNETGEPKLIINDIGKIKLQKEGKKK